MSPAALSVDPTLHSKLLRKVRVLAKEQAVGVAGMGKSLGIVLAAEAAKGSGTDDDVCSIHTPLLSTYMFTNAASSR